MTNKQIVDAQKVLRRLEGTPVKIQNDSGQVFWQVTYDNETYNNLLNVVTAVASTPIKESYTTTYVNPNVNPNNLPPEATVISVMDYHRDRI